VSQTRESDPYVDKSRGSESLLFEPNIDANESTGYSSRAVRDLNFGADSDKESASEDDEWNVRSVKSGGQDDPARSKYTSGGGGIFSRLNRSDSDQYLFDCLHREDQDRSKPSELEDETERRGGPVKEPPWELLINNMDDATTKVKLTYCVRENNLI